MKQKQRINKILKKGVSEKDSYYLNELITIINNGGESKEIDNIIKQYEI